MENNTENIKEGKYIYCIIRHSDPIAFGPIGIGKRADMVYGVSYKDISAIVSNSPVIRYEARRVNMTAHEMVVEEVMKHFTVLPVRFSTISESNEDSAIRRILEKNYDKFSNLLKEMDGKKELGLKAIAVEETIYKHILEKYHDISTLKEKIAHLQPEKTYHQRMRIGEMVETALQEENELFKNYILKLLTPHSEDKKINDNYGGRMILNAAFLIKKEKEPELDELTNELDNKYKGLITFKYVGTLPPYNFVNLVINTEEN